MVRRVQVEIQRHVRAMNQLNQFVFSVNVKRVSLVDA